LHIHKTKFETIIEITNNGYEQQEEKKTNLHFHLLCAYVVCSFARWFYIYLLQNFILHYHGAFVLWHPFALIRNTIVFVKVEWKLCFNFTFGLLYAQHVVHICLKQQCIQFKFKFWKLSRCRKTEWFHFRLLE
jgi:glycosyltransferase involved in cell wall biosynthesis